MEIKTEEKQIMEKKLRDNMIRYVSLKESIEVLVSEQELIKDENLEMVKKFGLKKGEYIAFDDCGLQIQLIESVKAKGVNQDGLIGEYGKEKTDFLKVILPKAVKMAIEIGKLPEEAEKYILKEDPLEYTKISKI